MSVAVNPSLPATLAVSIVIFHPDEKWLAATLDSLRTALEHAHAEGILGQALIHLVDNGARTEISAYASTLESHFPTSLSWLNTALLAGHGNCGYGAANNLAFAHAPNADYFLALNPDVVVGREAIGNAIRYLVDHAECGLVSPVATSPDGSPLYLVKDYPRLLTLAVRGFAPDFIRGAFRRRLSLYDRSDQPFDTSIFDARVVSGCFMFMRRTNLQRVEGFDPDFFLYFEDFDLSYRITAFSTAVRLPGCRVVHAGGNAADKGWRHIWLFAKSGARFFSRHGWRW